MASPLILLPSFASFRFANPMPTGFYSIVIISESLFADENFPNLEAAVEAFSQAWDELPTPPSLDEYLDGCEESQWPRLIVELIKVVLERRWQGGLRRLIEDYVVQFPELKDRNPPQSLLVKFRARKLAGDV